MPESAADESGGRGSSQDDFAYFRAIEDTFIRLRGAPLLLSPADWRAARSWQQQGIPLDLVCLTLEDVFRRRRERGAGGRIQSLRYCSDAVLAVWQERQELESTGKRVAAARVDVAGRLAVLATHLPENLAEREGWTRRIRALGGDAQEVESALSRFDRELLEALDKALTPEQRTQVDAEVQESLGAVRARLPDDRVGDVRRRLRDQRLRKLWSTPVLSLFSPEATKVLDRDTE